MEKVKERFQVDRQRMVSPEGSLRIEVEPSSRSSQTAVIRLRGYVDLFSTTFLNHELDALEATGVRNMLVDLRDVGFVASVGVGTMVAWHKRLSYAEGKLVCFSMPNRVAEVFRLLGFERYLHVADNEEDALALLDKEQAHTAFPRVAACPICGKRVKLRSAGVYRCPQCSTVLRVSEEGRFSLG